MLFYVGTSNWRKMPPTSSDLKFVFSNTENVSHIMIPTGAMNLFNRLEWGWDV
jgi:hypothetical protein